MPHTLPSFARKDWGHNFHKPEGIQETIYMELNKIKKEKKKSTQTAFSETVANILIFGGMNSRKIYSSEK